MAGEEVQFSTLRERIVALAKSTAEEKVKGELVYHASQSQDLVRDISAQISKDLLEISQDFKFIVSCKIVPKNSESGLHGSNACVWDAVRDGMCSVQVESPAILCIIDIFGVHF